MRRRYLAVLLLPVTLTGCGYNTIQSLDEQAAQSQHQIEVQLQRRSDLIPNLVETVKGYAKHEEAVFIEVAQARSGLNSAIQTHDPARMATANDQLTTVMSRFALTVEAYPQLKADQSFLRLQDELTGTENRIAVSRTDYNQSVQQYNTYIRRFPALVTAKVIGSRARTYFEVTNAAAKEAPKVDFGTGGAAGASEAKKP